MRVVLLSLLLLLGNERGLLAQRSCFSFDYEMNERKANPSIELQTVSIEAFTQKEQIGIALGQPVGEMNRGEGKVVVVVPVVFHVLYNTLDQRNSITQERVIEQLNILNQAFNKKHPDSIYTPDRFKHLSADISIEFRLATTDPWRRATSGIIRKYSPVKDWKTDDKLKYTAETGSDAWDPDSYLNIWIARIGNPAGYSSFPGGEKSKDGIVINYYAFGTNRGVSYNKGKTLVHEAGHWLNLRHIWGDAYCGDDFVDDTPTQANFTMGCPSDIHTSCENGPAGDMYMNYMDLTDDNCTNMFTPGQAIRMRTLFRIGGARRSILFSKAFEPALFEEIPLDEGEPNWPHLNLYPNPTKGETVFDVSADRRWIGEVLTITSITGQEMFKVRVEDQITTINTSHLAAGYYFIRGTRKDGATLVKKFLKQ